MKYFQVLWDSVAGGDDWCVTALAVISGLQQVVSSLVDPSVPGLAKRGKNLSTLFFSWKNHK